MKTLAPTRLREGATRTVWGTPLGITTAIGMALTRAMLVQNRCQTVRSRRKRITAVILGQQWSILITQKGKVEIRCFDCNRRLPVQIFALFLIR